MLYNFIVFHCRAHTRVIHAVITMMTMQKESRDFLFLSMHVVLILYRVTVFCFPALHVAGVLQSLSKIRLA